MCRLCVSLAQYSPHHFQMHAIQFLMCTSKFPGNHWFPLCLCSASSTEMLPSEFFLGEPHPSNQLENFNYFHLISNFGAYHLLYPEFPQSQIDLKRLELEFPQAGINSGTKSLLGAFHIIQK